MTYEEALRRGFSQLSARPELREHALQDAALLLRHQLGIDRATLKAHPEREITREQQEAYHALVQRRLLFEPIQYITGVVEFYGLALHVTPAVLIPRPETEHLVEAVFTRVPKDSQIRIADVGTGSGAIAIALAHLLPRASIVATDLSGAALRIARRNAERHGLSERIAFVEADLLEGIEGCFDAVVSNPPYIPNADAATMHPQVTGFEPAAALFAGATGFEIYERLVPQAYAALKPGGLLGLEIGFGQRDRVADLLAPWESLEFVDDLQGIARVALAYRLRA
jgi:release factor glutamine methyltransferase